MGLYEKAVWKLAHNPMEMFECRLKAADLVDAE